MKKDISERHKQINRFVHKLNFPNPARIDEIEALLIKENILREDYKKEK